MASLFVPTAQAQAQVAPLARVAHVVPPGHAAQVVAPAQAARVASPVRAEVQVRGQERRDPSNLTELRKEAELSAKELEEATKALEKRRADIAASEKALKTKLTALQTLEQRLEVMRQPVSQMAELLYEQPIVADGIVPFLSGSADEKTLRAMSDATQMVTVRQQAVEQTSALYKESERLAAEAQELRAGNLLAEAQLAAEVDTLRQRSDKIVKSLTAALVKLGIKIDKVGRDALGCNPLRAGTADNYPNGLIPQGMLCPLQQKGFSLRADATIAFVSLNEAYRRQFGKSMCVTDAYRSLAEQQSVYYRRPGFAAVPGRSNHGLGLAVDLCGGVDRSGSAEFVWMEKNSKRYGWFHPAWAYSNPFEPWHWEYDPKIDSLL
ncbi:D-alanyl-D-alanine carboxypeptidase family protein [Nonomuraea sp. K274]|uniref:D-alanyl-D-alanine carboxypeptidase family protein n=2 Tax=Nonomuraea cypriaca TaxID=1187855 RepID=A0A931AL63_9ACTN|nr:D-alanyl-D-alanine carboxypeptidase family protein [Nonomuraea cypriaca]